MHFRSVSWVIIVGIVATALTACGGSSKSPAPVAGKATSAPSGNPAPSSASTSGDTLDITLTGGLQAHWKTGDSGASVHCNLLSNQLRAAFSGNIGTALYGMGVLQEPFAAGSYTLPSTATGAAELTQPSVQITTSSNSKAQWDLGHGRGKGTVSLAGGNASTPLSGTIDGDLADVQGGAAVHVSGNFKCKPQTG